MQSCKSFALKIFHIHLFSIFTFKFQFESHVEIIHRVFSFSVTFIVLRCADEVTLSVATIDWMLLTSERRFHVMIIISTIKFWIEVLLKFIVRVISFFVLKAVREASWETLDISSVYFIFNSFQFTKEIFLMLLQLHALVYI